jgi:hypothetical protein
VKSPWVLVTAGANTTISSTGTGYWKYSGVLISWSSSTSSSIGSASGPANLLAIVLPCVLGGILLLALLAGAALLHRRRLASKKAPRAWQDVEQGELLAARLLDGQAPAGSAPQPGGQAGRPKGGCAAPAHC